MNAVAPVTVRFISVVRRRIVAARIAESVAIGAAIAVGAGLMLAPILWWRGESASLFSSAILTIGAICGLIWGISRLPSSLEAAIEADRQLNLDDLLGTIVLMDNADRSAWAESVWAYAENRCRSLRASQVIVNRIGIRGWAGVGILGSLLLVFTMLTGRPASVSAAPSAIALGSADSAAQADGMSELSQPTGRPPGPGGTDASNRGFANDHAVESTNAGVPGRDSHFRSASGMDLATGGGSAVTPPPEESAELNQLSEVLGGPSQGGDAGAGMGPSDSGAIATGDGNSTFANASPGVNVAPWSTPRWRADAAAARNAIASGRVPDADADLVRGYFRRD